MRNFLLSENRKLINDLLIQSILLKAIIPIITAVVSTYTPVQTSIKDTTNQLRWHKLLAAILQLFKIFVAF